MKNDKQKNKKQINRQLGEVVLKAWTDDGYRQRLQQDPKTALQEAGFPVPEGMQVKVVEESDNVAYVVIPKKPDNLQVSDFRSDDASWCWSFNALGCF